jgi:hypothetical protein
MTNVLTNEDKIAIINSHITNISQNKYNSELSLIEENAKSNKEQSVIDKINQIITDYSDQITALEAEKDKLK